MIINPERQRRRIATVLLIPLSTFIHHGTIVGHCLCRIFPVCVCGCRPRMIPDPLPFCGDIIEANPIVTAQGEKIGDMGIFSSGFNCYEPGIIRFTNSLSIRPAHGISCECIACPPSGVLRAKVRGTSAVGRGEPGEKEKENTLHHALQPLSCHTTSSRYNSHLF
jgi:hypothetical protein